MCQIWHIGQVKVKGPQRAESLEHVRGHILENLQKFEQRRQGGKLDLWLMGTTSRR